MVVLLHVLLFASLLEYIVLAGVVVSRTPGTTAVVWSTRLRSKSKRCIWRYADTYVLNLVHVSIRIVSNPRILYVYIRTCILIRTRSYRYQNFSSGEYPAGRILHVRGYNTCMSSCPHVSCPHQIRQHQRNISLYGVVWFGEDMRHEDMLCWKPVQ